MIKLLNNICKVAVIFLLTASTSFAADKVKLRLNWMYYGSHAGFALGFVDGTYAKHGIDIDIRSGNGSSSEVSISHSLAVPEKIAAL